MLNIDYSAPLDEDSLVVEVSSGTFCFKNKIKPASVKLLWSKLSQFILDTLKLQKGILLPNLGTFRIGPIIGENKQRIRPVFNLLETRYQQVSQERPKYLVGGKPAIVQPNYGLLATASAVHRGACQRLLAELLQRLGVHILSGRPIKVGFPGVGRLVTNKAARMEFVFDPVLMDHFESDRYGINPEMAYGDEGVQQVVKGVRRVAIQTPPHAGAGASSPSVRAAPAPAQPRRSASPAPLAKHTHAPYKGGLLDLFRLCRTHDKINSGCVLRLQLEGWLAKEASSVLASVDAATVMQLLSTNTYGKTGKHVVYKTFLDGLEAAIGNVTPTALLPHNVQSPRRVVEVRLQSPHSPQHYNDQQQQYNDQQYSDEPHEDQQYNEYYEEDDEQGGPHEAQGDGYGQQGYEDHDALEVTLSPGQAPPPHPFSQHAPQAAHPFMHNNAQKQAPPTRPSQEQQQQAPGGYQLRVVPPSPAFSQAPYVHSPSPQPTDVIHYYQHSMSPRSRSEYDNFNRVHFQRLDSARGPANKNRAITPKVGEEPLNQAEYQALKVMDGVDRGVAGAVPAAAGGGGMVDGGRHGTPSPRGAAVAAALGQRREQPYSGVTPQPITQSPPCNRGPAAQILQVMHAPSSASPSHAYPPAQQRQGGGLPPRRPSGPPPPAINVNTPSGTGPGAYGGQYGTPAGGSRSASHAGPASSAAMSGAPSSAGAIVGGARAMSPVAFHRQQHQHQQLYYQQQQQQRGMPMIPFEPPPQSPMHVASPALQHVPISQYEIINESDPILRQRKRSELAHGLQAGWIEQIREKERIQASILDAEQQWPYVQVGQPNDKRPISAVNRPSSPFKRAQALA